MTREQDPTGSTSVIELYRHALERRGYLADASEMQAVERLQQLYEEWATYKPRRGTALRKLPVDVFYDNGIKLIAFAVIVLFLWHAALRIFHMLHDFGVHVGAGSKLICFCLALLCTIPTAYWALGHRYLDPAQSVRSDQLWRAGI
ncbi:MAG: fumarate reductase subunit D [Burkholderiales bacterium]